MFYKLRVSILCGFQLMTLNHENTEIYLTREKWLNVAESVFVKYLNENNTKASLFKIVQKHLSEGS